MTGTPKGGRKARDKNKRRYGEQYYKTIGKLGGLKSRGGGFAKMKLENPERLKEISKKGGLV